LETILLSINPEYVEKIFAGTKKYEFRKRLPSKAIDKILIYSTAPIMKVVGEVQIVETISSSPTALWKRTKKFAGISREKYRKYFKGCKVAYAFQLGQVIKYDPPKELQDFNISSPPQSFIYLLVEQADNEESN
jgi:predicted transcriptional regulator